MTFSSLNAVGARMPVAATQDTLSSNMHVPPLCQPGTAHIPSHKIHISHNRSWYHTHCTCKENEAWKDCGICLNSQLESVLKKTTAESKFKAAGGKRQLQGVTYSRAPFIASLPTTPFLANLWDPG